MFNNKILYNCTNFTYIFRKKKMKTIESLIFNLILKLSYLVLKPYTVKTDYREISVKLR